MKKTKTISTTVLGAAIMCAALASVVTTLPAFARPARSAGCSSANLAKVEGNMEAMADWGTKPVVTAEIAAASTALSNGDARGCAAHIGKAEHLEAASANY